MKKTKLLILTALLFPAITACNSNNNSSLTSVLETEIHSISLKSAPTKQVYEINETLDLTGAVITVIYNNGDPKDIPVTLDMIEEVDMSTEGEKTVIIKYKNKQTAFTITVNDSREYCPITFNGSNQYIYDGNPKKIEYSIPDGVNHSVEYQQNEVFYSTYENAPSNIGIYSLVVKTEGNTQYKPTIKWFTFSIVENKPEAEVTFSDVTTFTYDGNGHTPTYTVTNDLESKVEYLYSESEEWCGYEPPTEIGNYILCVTVKASETTRETKRYCEFAIIDSAIDKITPTITFGFERGTRFNIGETPTYTIKDESGNEISDADVTVNYTSDTTGYNSSDLPMTAGDYGITVTVNADDKYNKVSNSTWFRITSKSECPITFTGNNKYESGSSENIEITVPTDVKYDAYYEKDGVRYSDYKYGLPQEEGYYSLVVEVEEDDTYDYTKKWFIFEITERINQNKITPTITFNFDAGTKFALGETPTYTIKDESGNEISDADVTVNYTSDTTGYNSSDLPMTAGDYGITVTVNADDKYNKVSLTTWFRITSKSECPIEINLNGDTVFVLGEERQIEINVPNGVTYHAEYQKDDKFYSSFEDGLPQEEGYYAVVVTTEENEQYSASGTFVVIRIVIEE